ncbi:hypothetical protein KM043_013432 [Ampulex compressa]|nr:hypothetical protein KM043_013432 [Ampulex compressa]
MSNHSHLVIHRGKELRSQNNNTIIFLTDFSIPFRRTVESLHGLITRCTNPQKIDASSRITIHVPKIPPSNPSLIHKLVPHIHQLCSAPAHSTPTPTRATIQRECKFAMKPKSYSEHATTDYFQTDLFDPQSLELRLGPGEPFTAEASCVFGLVPEHLILDSFARTADHTGLYRG